MMETQTKLQRQHSTTNIHCMPVTPGTPETTNLLLGAAGHAAYGRRHHNLRRQKHQSKSIMNCFRDRSSSYMRYNSNNQSGSTLQTRVPFHAPNETTPTSPTVDTGRPEAVVFLRELRTRPKKLALLKSSSTRDLSRLISESDSATTLLASRPSLEMLATTTNTSSSSGASTASGSPRNRRLECCNSCHNHWQELKQRIHFLEQDLQSQITYTKRLEKKVNELSTLLTTDAFDKRKKQPTVRKKSTAQATAAHAGGGLQPSKLVAWMNLANWWKSRPSIETLKQQNIYNDEPCFDTEIELVLKHELHKTVPRIVIDCCDLIELLYRRSTQPIEGIYRQCGDYNKIQTLRFRIDANDYASLRQPNVDIHTLSGVLKLFLREIKHPLVSVNEAKTFIGKPNQWLLMALPTKVQILKRLIRSLPEINRDTMDYLFSHFNRLTKVPLQQISAETLSISITPSIFHTVPRGGLMQDMEALLRETEMLADCVKIMIEYQQRIFDAREGIKIINALPYDTFTTVLLYVHRQMSPSGAGKKGGQQQQQNMSTLNNNSSQGAGGSSDNAIQDDAIDAENALEELERLVGVPRADFLLLIKTFSYILRRISTFIIKPSLLQKELREKLQMQDDAKIDAILRLWVRQTTPIMNNLACERYESNEVHDIAWKLNVEISSQCQQREKSALAVLQLKTGAGEDINIEMNHDELLQLYNQFESIQNELDATIANINTTSTAISTTTGQNLA